MRDCLLLFLGMLLLFSCQSDDKKIKADLPELTYKHIFMTGDMQPIRFGLTFTLDDVPFVGLGRFSSMGQDRNFYYYVPDDCTWKSVGVEFIGDYREDAVAFVIEKKVYIGLGVQSNFGEKTYYDDFFVYDHETHKWSSLPFKFPGEARQGAVAFSLNGKGYVGTGITQKNKCLADFYEFDPKIGWTKIQNIDNPRYGASSFVLDGYGYVCFGNLFENDQGNSDVQRFDPESKTWMRQPVYYEEGELEEINKRDKCASFVMTKNGQDFLYIWGGDVRLGSQTLWGYNPRKNVWKYMMNMEAEYGFSAGGCGYAMYFTMERFEANIFHVIQ